MDPGQFRTHGLGVADHVAVGVAGLVRGEIAAEAESGGAGESEGGIRHGVACKLRRHLRGGGEEDRPGLFEEGIHAGQCAVSVRPGDRQAPLGGPDHIGALSGGLQLLRCDCPGQKGGLADQDLSPVAGGICGQGEDRQIGAEKLSQVMLQLPGRDAVQVRGLPGGKNPLEQGGLAGGGIKQALAVRIIVAPQAGNSRQTNSGIMAKQQRFSITAALPVEMKKLHGTNYQIIFVGCIYLITSIAKDNIQL